MRNPKAPAPPRYSQPDGYEARSRAPVSSPAPRVTPEAIEPEGFEEEQGETRPALGDEAKKALEIAAARRKSLSPIVEKDAPTAALNPNEFSNALAQLQRQRQAGAPAPAPPPSSRSGAVQGLQGPPSQRPPPGAPQGPASQRPPPSAGQTGANRPISIKPPPPQADVPDLRDLASSVRRSMASIPPPINTGPPPPPVVTDDPKVISALLGGAVPPVSSATAPMGTPALGLKPGTGMPLAPQRTPLPIAVVGGGGGLRVQPDRPGSIPPGVNPTKTTPSATAQSRPPGAMGSRPPGAMGSRPPGAVHTPTGPKQYDFKRWSSPDISEMPNDGSPVTFQVYTAQDVASGRGPMRSLPVIQPDDKKPNIGVKIALAVVGGVIVLITAAAVIMVSTDDPKHDRIAPVGSDSASPSAEPPPPEPAPLPPGPGIVIGDPLGAASEEPESPAPSAKKPPKKPAPVGEPRVEPAAPKTNSGGGGVTPPPNPYGSPGK
ncbi:MAG: hypothetical protein KIT84_15015 [Labilithrix sp.]|nr:hypothetical protein [Labilithrix sp.]MCW5812334.1 hypothetical protein [Labilithrix sp.]